MTAMTIKSFAVGFIGALIAVSLSFISYTAYQDHQLVRALVSLEQQRAAAAAQPK